MYVGFGNKNKYGSCNYRVVCLMIDERSDSDHDYL